MVSIPFSKNRRYLTGIDWILHGFDFMNKRATGAGNAFQIVMELDGAPSENEFRDSLEGFLRKFPLLSGKTRRDYNLAPYWEMPPRTHKSASTLDVRELQEGEDPFLLLEGVANAPFCSERQHLAFYLVRSAENSHVAVKFDHRLFDAHGAEMFLRMFQQDWEKGGASTWEFPLVEPAHLSHWRDKFEAGQQVNRALLRLAKDAPPRALSADPSPNGQRFRFKVVPFTESKSREIIERAESEAGYLMAMPYTMALTVQALHSVFAERGIDTGDYVIPVTMDARPRGGQSQDAFFNHVSLLLFRIRAREASDRSALLDTIKQQLDTIKQQMYDQVRTGLARHISEASLLIRIVPLRAVSHLLKLYLTEKIASFCFSYLGDAGYMPSRFMGQKIRSSYHMPRIPVPPGLGVFFQQSQGRLNASFSYTEGLLSEGEVNSVLDAFKSEL
jgi:hypothetical protein